MILGILRATTRHRLLSMETIMTEWELHGMEFGNCNCAYACPCQFNALPTHGNCQAIGFFSVEKGHFGDAKLDGLNMADLIAINGEYFDSNRISRER